MTRTRKKCLEGFDLAPGEFKQALDNLGADGREQLEVVHLRKRTGGAVQIGNAGLQELSERVLPNLHTLIASNQQIGGPGLRALTQAPFVGQLKHLDLNGTSFAKGPLTSLLAADWSALEQLALDANRLALDPLVEASSLTGLRRLKLGHNIAHEQLQTLAKAPILGHLTLLDLRGNCVNRADLEALLASPYLPPLLELRLDPSNETPWGQVYVRGKTKNRVPAWRRERPQKLPAQGLTPEEWRALNEDPWPTLEHLDLGFDLRTLLDANSELKTLSPACFPALQSCSLCDPAITEQMLASLIKSPLADQLCHLQFIPEAVTTAQLREIESATAYAPGRFKHLELARELSNAELFRAAEVAEALGCLEQARAFLERREPLEWTEEGGVVVFWCQTLNQLGRADEARTRLEKEYKRQLPMWARDCGPLLVANQLLTQYLILGELGQAEPFVSSYAPRVNRWTDASWHLTAALVHKRLGHLKPMKAALTRAGRAIKRSLKQPEEVSQALAHQAAMLAMRGKHKDAIASLRASLRASSHKPWWAKILWGTVVLDELKDEKPVRTLLQKYAPSVTQFERLTY